MSSKYFQQPASNQRISQPNSQAERFTAASLHLMVASSDERPAAARALIAACPEGQKERVANHLRQQGIDVATAPAARSSFSAGM